MVLLPSYDQRPGTLDRRGAVFRLDLVSVLAGLQLRVGVAAPVATTGPRLSAGKRAVAAPASASPSGAGDGSVRAGRCHHRSGGPAGRPMVPGPDLRLPRPGHLFRGTPGQLPGVGGGRRRGHSPVPHLGASAARRDGGPVPGAGLAVPRAVLCRAGVQPVGHLCLEGVVARPLRRSSRAAGGDRRPFGRARFRGRSGRRRDGKGLRHEVSLAIAVDADEVYRRECACAARSDIRSS